MKTEKMSYVKPTVQKVEFDFKTRIAGSGSTCYWPSDMVGAGDDECMN